MVFLVYKLSFEILFSVISQAALMVGPTLGQRRDDSADVGPALGQRLGRPSMLSGIVVSVFCFVLFCYQLVVCFFVASPVSDTILSDNKWAKFSFAELLYVRTWQWWILATVSCCILLPYRCMALLPLHNPATAVQPCCRCMTPLPPVCCCYTLLHKLYRFGSLVYCYPCWLLFCC